MFTTILYIMYHEITYFWLVLVNTTNKYILKPKKLLHKSLARLRFTHVTTPDRLFAWKNCLHPSLYLLILTSSTLSHLLFAYPRYASPPAKPNCMPGISKTLPTFPPTNASFNPEQPNLNHVYHPRSEFSCPIFISAMNFWLIAVWSWLQWNMRPSCFMSCHATCAMRHAPYDMRHA